MARLVVVSNRVSVPSGDGAKRAGGLEVALRPTLQRNGGVWLGWSGKIGVRDKLRVLLVSGEPHAGERTWRNLLKSDPSVDLVHFTILRPPEKQDGTPINELSLIAFPTRELFQQKINEFQLIIFDRYARQGVLPILYFDNIAKYVRDGGAVLVAHKTPGHTKWCTTWTMRVPEGGKTYDVVIVGSPNLNTGYKLVNNTAYPQIAQDYEQMFRVLKALPCDVFLGAHGEYYDIAAKYARLKDAGTNPFIDPDGYKAYIADREQVFETELKRQQDAQPQK